MCGANGCNVDSDIAGGLPPCHEGAAAGFGCASAGTAKAAATATARVVFIRVSPLESVLERKRSLDANGHVAPRRGLVIAAVGLVDDDGADVVAVTDIVHTPV